MKISSRSLNAGATLLELSVTLALVGTLSLASYPLFLRRTGANLRVGAGDILACFRLARSRAITTRTNVYVDFFVEGGKNGRGFFSAFLDKDHDRKVDPGEEEASGIAQPDRWDGRLGRELPRGVCFGARGVGKGPRGAEIPADGISLSGRSNRLGLYPRGNSGLGTVYVSDGAGGVRAVRVLLSGAMEAWNWRMDDSRWFLD